MSLDDDARAERMLFILYPEYCRAVQHDLQFAVTQAARYDAIFQKIERTVERKWKRHPEKRLSLADTTSAFYQTRGYAKVRPAVAAINRGARVVDIVDLAMGLTMLELAKQGYEHMGLLPIGD